MHELTDAELMQLPVADVLSLLYEEDELPAVAASLAVGGFEDETRERTLFEFADGSLS